MCQWPVDHVELGPDKGILVGAKLRTRNFGPEEGDEMGIMVLPWEESWELEL